MGKSRLAAEFARKAGDAGRRRGGRGVPVVRHQHELLRLARGLVDAVPPRRRACPRAEQVQRARGGARRDRSRRSCRARRCSAALLDLPIPDNELTAPVRREAAQDLARRAARRMPSGAGEPRRRSCSCSRIATGSTRCRATCSRCSRARWRACACCIVLAYRPSANVDGKLGIGSLAHFTEIALAGARRRGCGAAHPVDACADAAPEGTSAPAALVELVTARAQGNPFYIEELLNFIQSQGVDPQDAAALKNLQLPESLHSLILSRIDTLGEAPRRTLKVASVLGRVFRAPMLPGVYPELGGAAEVDEHLRTLMEADLVNVGPGGRADLSLQARRHPGGRVREPAVRVPLDAARALSAASSRPPRPTRSSATSTCSRTTTGTARTCRRSANTSAAPATRRRPPTPMRRRSTTSSAWRRWWSRARASTCC